MRSDYGGENKLIQTFQVFHGKKIKLGSSVHNTTVERMCLLNPISLHR